MMFDLRLSQNDLIILFFTKYYNKKIDVDTGKVLYIAFQ